MKNKKEIYKHNDEKTFNKNCDGAISFDDLFNYLTHLKEKYSGKTINLTIYADVYDDSVKIDPQIFEDMTEEEIRVKNIKDKIYEWQKASDEYFEYEHNEHVYESSLKSIRECKIESNERAKKLYQELKDLGVDVDSLKSEE